MRKQNGFTLIELMIVVAIIAILVALILPYFTGNGDANMGTSGGTYADTPASYLVCKDSFGVETLREPAIPGEQWHADGDNYVTANAHGKPHIVTTPDGGQCTIETGA
jgi:prepilin-type N-terminal cleavage/methylation domain-containing protein